MKYVITLSLLFVITIQVHGNLQITGESLVDTVWVANKVSFDLHTVGNLQWVSYYDMDRNMSVASRRLGSDCWKKTILPSKLMWDSHNYVTMGIDEKGYLHVSGNMHNHPLSYFKSESPYDSGNMLELDKMAGMDENDVTYPKFFNDRDGRLYFSYRSGTCGNGNILVNRYNTESGCWERYLDKPLFEGIESDDDRAAYHNFVKDDEGNFHFIWIWRWTPLVETSHQICYATTPDLISWKNAAGKALSLPFRPDDPDVIVDGTPSRGGMHNGRFKIILTKEGNPVIAYVKYDEAGLTQLYMARIEKGRWVSKKISDWNFRWEFHGGGDQMSRGGNFHIAGLDSVGSIVIRWDTETGESGYYTVDPYSLDCLPGAKEIPNKYPDSIHERMSDIAGLSVNLMTGKGESTQKGSKYLLKWESAKKSHGSHAPDVIPDGPISQLKVMEIR